jgi:BTB/POZ domain
VYASDVFKEMFLSAEKAEGPIVVTDISPGVFKKLLL